LSDLEAIPVLNAPDVADIKTILEDQNCVSFDSILYKTSVEALYTC